MGFDPEAEQDKEVKAVKKAVKKKEVKQTEDEKTVSVEELLMNHEQRIVQMEAKWFRLGGI